MFQERGEGGDVSCECPMFYRDLQSLFLLWLGGLWGEGSRDLPHFSGLKQDGELKDEQLTNIK